jgi:tetratricopeptide (TPR) repeat protein
LKIFPLSNCYPSASETVQPAATLADLESFSFQQQTGQETRSLISFLAGFIDYRSGNYGAAIDQFDKSLQNPSQTPLFLENLAQIYFYRGNSYHALAEYPRAIQDFDQAIQIDPHAEAYVNRGRAYAESEEYQRAVEDFDQAIRINPQLAVAYYNRGTAYADLGENEQAIENFDSHRIRSATDSYINRGVILDNLGDYQHAIEEYNKAIQINSQDAAAYYNRGRAYLFLEDYQLAIKDFDQTIRINPHLQWQIAEQPTVSWGTTGMRSRIMTRRSKSIHKIQRLTGFVELLRPNWEIINVQ